MLKLKKYNRPDAVNAPGYFWLLNGVMTEEKLRGQIRDMAKAGARSVCPHPLPKEFRTYFHSKMAPNYLSPEYFEMYKIIIDECKKQGMNSYLYDEGGWPSGGACGQVYASNPKKFIRKMVKLDGNGGYFIAEDAVDPEKSTVPNILEKGCVEKFLELTHEKYFNAVGDRFGKNIHFAFTDEPSMVQCAWERMTWCDDFPEVFQERKGYDVRPYIVRLIQGNADSEVSKVRIDYHDVMSQLFVERYMLPIRDWCRKHGIKSGGHVSGEDDWFNMQFRDFGHPLRALRALDEPGVDLIWRQLWPGQRMHPFPKLASSVGNQGGHRHVLGELFGVYGNGLTFEQMKYLADFMFLNGVNTHVYGCRPYSTEDAMEGERPHFGPVNPQWWIIKPFHEYVSRQSYLSTSSKPAVDTALFLDIRTMWGTLMFANYSADYQVQIAEMLSSRQVDFDYIDDDALAAATIQHGKLKIGCALYERLVMPVKANLAPEAQKNLERIKKAGFPVISSTAIDTIRPTLAVEGGNMRIRVRKHVCANGDTLYFVMNTSEAEVKASFVADEKKPVALCNSEDGNVYTLTSKKEGKWEWTFRPYSMNVFLLSDDMCGALPMPPSPGECVAQLSRGWKIRPIRKVVVGEHDFEISDCDEKAVPARLGDWKETLGEAFSGTAEYSITFQGNGARFIDLGDVKYAAKVFLNGKCLGTRLYPPYVFSVGDAMKDGANRLKIQVTNTLANAMAPEEVYERWKQQFQPQSSYEIRQRSYERESLPSGLFGPVQLRG